MGTVVLLLPRWGRPRAGGGRRLRLAARGRPALQPLPAGREVSRLIRGELARLRRERRPARGARPGRGGAHPERRRLRHPGAPTRWRPRPDRSGQGLGGRAGRGDPGGRRRALGWPPAGMSWRVGVAPRAAVADRRGASGAGGTSFVLEADDLSVATSGIAERGRHITDGRTGTVPRELRQITVAGPSLARADGYATGAFAMGIDGLRWRGATRLRRVRHDAGRAAHRDPRPAALPAHELTGAVRHG